MDEFGVIIAGSRSFHDYDLLEKKMDIFLANKKDTHKIVIISGGASGADRLGEQYAGNRGYALAVFKAMWDKYGKRAGYIRNEAMAVAGDALVAFWNGKSKGTKHMIDIADRMHLPIRVVKF